MYVYFYSPQVQLNPAHLALKCVMTESVAFHAEEIASPTKADALLTQAINITFTT